MSTYVSVSLHDGMPHAIDSVGCDLDYILDQDSMYHWLSEDERIKLKEVQNILSDLEKR